MAEIKKNDKKEKSALSNEVRQTIRELKIAEHIDILRANGVRVEVERIGDTERPPIEIVHGMRFCQLMDRTARPLAIAKKHADLFGEGLLRTGRFGDPMLDFPVAIHAAYMKQVGSDLVFIDEESRCMVECATPLAFYRDGKCTIPETPVSGLVTWNYNNGRKVAGWFLPLDLEKADKEGWFMRAAAHKGVKATVGIFPGVRKDRDGKVRGIEPQAIHPSGLKIVSPLPPIVAWCHPCEFMLTQRGDMIIAVPLPAVGTALALEAVEEAVASGEIDLGDGIEVGPEEMKVGKGELRSIWTVLESAHDTDGVTFDAITVDSSYNQLRDASRAIAFALHPDKVQGRMTKVPGVSANFIARAVKQAGLQFNLLDTAFKKALAARDEQLKAVNLGLEAITMEADALSEASKADDGEDVFTTMIGKALHQGFSWKNPNHRGLRNHCLGALRKLLKAAEEATKAAAAAADEAPPAAPEADAAPPEATA